MSGKILSILFVTGLMVGCAGSYSHSVKRAHYLLDTAKGELCIEGRNACQSLSLIVPSFQEHVIAAGYKLPKKAYQWSATELQSLMLQPPGNPYQPETLSANLYRLPPVYAVHSVWDVLAWEHYILYERGDRFDYIERPVPRRF